jgi:6-phosphofructokinase 1
MTTPNRLAILVGGGPAPGINSVIASATIRACTGGLDVVGVSDGFQWLSQGDTSRVEPLTIAKVSRWHFEGGSHLGTSRANPTKDARLLENVVNGLLSLGVTKLMTIGGDDTAFSAMKVQEQAAGRVHVVHVPKTIDNDLDLPGHIDTFGYQTARHYGVQIVRNLMVDAKTTSRWYFAVAMGRTAGHLALGIGKAAGATVTLIGEEFARPVRLRAIVDTLAGSIIKRLSRGRPDGVAVIAEGVTLDLDPQDFEIFGDVERDAHGHVRLAEVNLGDVLKREVGKRLATFGVKTTIAEKNIGYELRCADPIPFDIEYTRELGASAAAHLLAGGSAAMVSIQDGVFVPVPFSRMIDPATGRTRVRRADVQSLRYAVARDFMIRLDRRDFEDPSALAALAATARTSSDAFRSELEYLTTPGVLAAAVR